MVRIYARENATQRTKQSTAIDGSVLAAVRFLARQLLTTSYEFVRGPVFESERSFATAKGTLEKGDGVGKDLVYRVLTDMPGIGIHAIIDSLSRLKASGDYGRTLLAVQQQIEAEAEAARLEAERLERERREAARPFPPFPPVPMGIQKAAETVQRLHILP